MVSPVGDIEVLEKTGQVNGDAFWRHRSGAKEPSGFSYLAEWLNR